MPLKNWILLIILALLKLQLPFFLSSSYEFHRDELLYLALGEHLQFGYLEVPPMIALWAAFLQHVLGTSLWAVHLIAALAGFGLILLVGMMAYEMGGKRFAVLFAGFIVLFSPAYLRVHTLFQPVGWDVLGWAWLSYLWILHLKTQKGRYLVGIGTVAGIFFMNKYSILFCVLAILVATLFSKERKWLIDKKLWIGVSIGLVIILPNLIWQFIHNFPLFNHMNQLKNSQLDHIAPTDFLLDQFMMHLPITWVWILGLTGLWKSQTLKPFRHVALFFITVILLFLLLSGKNYYTLGAFPVMFAAGAVAIERLTNERLFLRVPAIVVPMVLILPMLPFSIPILKPNKLAAYSESFSRHTKQNAFNRWEDGQFHAIPQDFADMLGWKQLTQLAAKAYFDIPQDERPQTWIYAENYGQAGAIDLYGEEFNLPKAKSFSSSYAMWIDEQCTAKNLIYINDQLSQMVKKGFDEVILVGELSEQYAREKGTKVWLLRHANSEFYDFYNKLYQEKTAFFR